MEKGESSIPVLSSAPGEKRGLEKKVPRLLGMSNTRGFPYTARHQRHFTYVGRVCSPDLTQRY